MSELKTYTINNVVINDSLLEQIDNVFQIAHISTIRENIAETIMNFASLPADQRPNNDFIFYVNQFYSLLKAMEPLQNTNRNQRQSAA